MNRLVIAVSVLAIISLGVCIQAEEKGTNQTPTPPAKVEKPKTPPPPPKKEEPKEPTPIETVKKFLQAVHDADKAKVEEVFDYQNAMTEINKIMAGKNEHETYKLEEIKDTLFEYFTSESGKKKVDELTNPTVKYAEQMDKKQEPTQARVTITKAALRADDLYKKPVIVELAKVDGKWKVRYFPRVYPIDAQEVTTGEPSKDQ